MKQSLLDTVLSGENDLSVLNIKNLSRRSTAYVDLGRFILLHQTPQLEAESIEKTRNNTWNYLQSMCSILNFSPEINNPAQLRWVTPEERQIILQHLGPPPPYCYPLYLISVGEGRDEKLVYVGKMSSETPRFRNGHLAITKLHGPQYSGIIKRVYMCSIVFLAEDSSYSPIEFFQPTSYADSILASLEAQLINFFQPELNTSNMVTANIKYPLSLIFQNSTETNFMEGTICHHESLPFPA